MPRVSFSADVRRAVRVSIGHSRETSAFSNDDLGLTLRFSSNMTKHFSVDATHNTNNVIIYLDNLMLAGPSESQLLQDLSTALWLFVALGFIINIPRV